MWTQKTWKLEQLKEYRAWIEANRHKYRIVELFVNNGWAVEYKKLLEA